MNFASSPLNLLRTDTPLFVAFVIAVIIAITFHEFSHALVATLQGDSTAKAQGRLTLNPISHIDPIGGFAIIIAGFGWGRPVPFSPGRLRSRRAGAAMVGLAGPGANLVLAILGAVIVRTLYPDIESALTHQGTFAFKLLIELVRLNIVLGIFNLLPIPPLDGSRLLSILLPPNRQQIVYFLDTYGIFLLLGVVLLAPRLLAPVFTGVENGIWRLVGLNYLVQ